MPPSKDPPPASSGGAAKPEKKKKDPKPNPNAKANKVDVISIAGQDDGYDHDAAPSLEQKVRVVAGKGEFAQRYSRGRELGLGAFSNVFLGTHRSSKKEYAVKKIDREKMIWGDSRDALEDEVNHLILVRLRFLYYSFVRSFVCLFVLLLFLVRVTF